MGENLDKAIGEICELEQKAKELKRKSEDPNLHQHERDDFFWEYKALMEEIEDKRYYVSMHAADMDP
jgi:hypothetical protein